MSLILITGGCGFIGSHVSRALEAAGRRIRILDDLSTGLRENAPAGAEVILGSVTDPHAIAEAVRGIDGCIHLAAIASVAQCREAWTESHEVNVTGTVRLLEAASKASKKFPVIYASSAAVYGNPAEIPLVETSRLLPISAYGADKLGSEWHASVARDSFGVPTVGLRPFNVYGPRQRADSPYSGVISLFADRLSRAEPLTIYGDGGQTRDFVYVGDVAKAFAAALDKAASCPPVMNICTNQSITILDLARLLGKLIGIPPVVNHAPARDGDIRDSRGDNALVRAHLGLTAFTPLAEGLAELLKRR